MIVSTGKTGHSSYLTRSQRNVKTKLKIRQHRPFHCTQPWTDRKQSRACNVKKTVRFTLGWVLSEAGGAPDLRGTSDPALQESESGKLLLRLFQHHLAPPSHVQIVHLLDLSSWFFTSTAFPLQINDIFRSVTHLTSSHVNVMRTFSLQSISFL